MAMVNRSYWSAAAASAAGISQQVLRSWRMRKFIRFEGEGGHGRANYRRADICALRTMASLIAFGLDCETSAQIALLERLRSLFASADYDRHAQFGDETEVIPAHDWTDPHRHHWVTVGYHDDGSPWLLEGGGHGRNAQLGAWLIHAVIVRQGGASGRQRLCLEIPRNLAEFCGIKIIRD